MILEPECSKRRCKHYTGVDQPDGTERTERVVCEAFPDGIPDDIAYGDDPHTESRNGEVTYEPDTGAD